MLLLQVMLEDITACKDLGVDGVVIGCLNKSGDVDREACGQLLTHAKNLVCACFCAVHACAQAVLASGLRCISAVV